MQERLAKQTNHALKKELAFLQTVARAETHTKDITEATSDATPQTIIVALVSFDPVPPLEPTSVIVDKATTCTLLVLFRPGREIWVS